MLTRSRCFGMLGRLRFRLLRLELLFAAQGTGERTNEFLTSNPIGHHPLERTTNPVLILTNQIGRGLCLAHALRGFQRCMSPDMASLEPTIRKVLHRIENLVLNVPETTHIVLKRRGIGNHHALYGFQLSCRIIHHVFLPHSPVTTKLGDRNRIRGPTPEPMPHSRDEILVLNPTDVKSSRVEQLHAAAS